MKEPRAEGNAKAMMKRRPAAGGPQTRALPLRRRPRQLTGGGGGGYREERMRLAAGATPAGSSQSARGATDPREAGRSAPRSQRRGHAALAEEVGPPARPRALDATAIGRKTSVTVTRGPPARPLPRAQLTPLPHSGGHRAETANQEAARERLFPSANNRVGRRSGSIRRANQSRWKRISLTGRVGWGLKGRPGEV